VSGILKQTLVSDVKGFIADVLLPTSEHVAAESRGKPAADVPAATDGCADTHSETGC